MKGLACATTPLPPGPKGHRLRNLGDRTKNYTVLANRLRQEYREIVSCDLREMLRRLQR